MSGQFNTQSFASYLSQPATLLGGTLASLEGIAAGAGVGDGPSLLAVASNDDAVRSRRAASVDAAGLHDGELVKGSGQPQEAEALVVAVLVRVRRAASGAAVLDKVASSRGGGVDLGRGVGDGAADGRGTGLELGGRREGNGGQGEDA
jgi:hypothetical protein